MSTPRADGLHFSRVWRAIMAVAAIATVTTIAAYSGRAVAQGQGQPPAQIQLTPKQIQNYVVAFKELSPLFEKLEATASGGKPDPKLLAALAAAVKKYGFRDLDEYDQVVVSIVAVLDGVDPKTRQYNDPIAMIKKEIASVQADKTMSPAERKKALESLNADLSEVQPVAHPGNIPLVLKFFDQLNPPQ